MPLPLLLTDFERARRRDSGPVAVLKYDNARDAAAAAAAFNRLLDVNQRGIDPATDGALNNYGDDNLRFDIRFRPEQLVRAKAVYHLMRAECDTYGKSQCSFNEKDGKFTISSPASDIPDLSSLAARAGLALVAHKGFQDFDPAPVTPHPRQHTVTLRFNAREFDGQQQGAVLRNFLHDLDAQDLLPVKLMLRGMDKYLTHQMTLAFDNLDDGLRGLQEPFLPAGFSANADYFVTKIDDAAKTVTLRSPPGAEIQFRENVFAPGAVKITVEKAPKP